MEKGKKIFKFSLISLFWTKANGKETLPLFCKTTCTQLIITERNLRKDKTLSHFSGCLRQGDVQISGPPDSAVLWDHEAGINSNTHNHVHREEYRRYVSTTMKSCKPESTTHRVTLESFHYLWTKDNTISTSSPLYI